MKRYRYVLWTGRKLVKIESLSAVIFIFMISHDLIVSKLAQSSKLAEALLHHVYRRMTDLTRACSTSSCFSVENRRIGHDSVQISDKGRRMAVAADQLQTGLQKLETGLCAEHSSTSNVGFNLSYFLFVDCNAEFNFKTNVNNRAGTATAQTINDACHSLVSGRRRAGICSANAPWTSR